MITTIVVSNREFVVAEQGCDYYKLHIFESQAQFKNWRAENKGSFVHRTNARGRMLPAKDHREEFEYC